MDEILRHYGFGAQDEENLKELAKLLLPYSNDLAEDFYNFLLNNPYSGSFFKTEEAIKKRKDTIVSWFKDLLASPYNNLYLARLQRIGQVHVRIGLKGHYVNAAMNFIRTFCIRQTAINTLTDGDKKENFWRL